MPEQTNSSHSEPHNALRRSGFLSELTVHEISRQFVDFGRQKRVLAIPIGFPQAGKSLLISSLMYFARRGAGTLFRTNLKNDFPFDKYATTRFCGSSFIGLRPNIEIEAFMNKIK